VEIRTRGKVIGQMVDSFTFYLAREVSVEKCDQTKKAIPHPFGGPDLWCGFALFQLAESDRELVLARWRLTVFNTFYHLRFDFDLLAARNLYAGLRENHQGLRPVSHVELALEG